MLYADAGIYLPESKAALVYSRLAKRLRALNLKASATIALCVRERRRATASGRRC